MCYKNFSQAHIMMNYDLQHIIKRLYVRCAVILKTCSEYEKPITRKIVLIIKINKQISI